MFTITASLQNTSEIQNHGDFEIIKKRKTSCFKFVYVKVSLPRWIIKPLHGDRRSCHFPLSGLLLTHWFVSKRLHMHFVNICNMFMSRNLCFYTKKHKSSLHKRNHFWRHLCAFVALLKIWPLFICSQKGSRCFKDNNCSKVELLFLNMETISPCHLFGFHGCSEQCKLNLITK